MPYVRENLEHGRQISGAEYAKALSELEQLRAHVTDFFSRYDLLLTPTLAAPAFPCRKRPTEIDGKKVNEKWGFTPFTFLFNMTGNPAASIPCGFSADGLPIGMHLVGRLKDEVTVLKASAAFEEAIPWADKLPPVS
jgi:Asp-tRNA(Asn)/Glu-tRNA(Gln) amidotransferase A subunit family amidase